MFDSDQDDEVVTVDNVKEEPSDQLSSFDVEWVPNTRSHLLPTLHVDKYRFQRNHLRGNYQTWKCKMRKGSPQCLVTATTLGTELKEMNGTHNHSPSAKTNSGSLSIKMPKPKQKMTASSGGLPRTCENLEPISEPPLLRSNLLQMKDETIATLRRELSNANHKLQEKDEKIAQLEHEVSVLSGKNEATKEILMQMIGQSRQTT